MDREFQTVIQPNDLADKVPYVAGDAACDGPEVMQLDVRFERQS
jgi:hypothetical protein